MRISGLAVVSTAVLPEPELLAVDLVLGAGTDVRSPADLHGIPIVAHPYGFLASTCMVVDHERPTEVSPVLWSILSAAEHQGCDWVMFDRDELLPVDG